MPVLSEAFSRNKNSLPTTSVFDKLRSTPLFSPSYPSEELEIPLKIVGGHFEKKRLTHLINTIARNSPTGRQILEDAARNDYILGFENTRGCHGTCDPTNRVLTLNPKSKDDKLISTLAHEARHAQQHTTGKFPELRKCDVATEVKLRRACEADANAAAVQTALEIRAATRDTAVWMEFFKEHIEISCAAEKKVSLLMDVEEVKKKQPEIMAVAFKEWFNDTGLVDAYEEHYLITPMMNCTYHSPLHRRMKTYEDNTYSQSFTSEQIVTSMCKTASGECYLEGEKNILDTPQMCSVFPLTKEVATAFFAKRREDKNIPVDKSFVNLPTKKEASWLAPDRCFVEEQEAKKAARNKREQHNKSSEISAVLAAKRQR